MQYSDLLSALDRDKLPVVVVVDGQVFWTIYGVEPWSAIRDANAPNQVILIVKVLIYTHGEVADSADS
jgi:hypothetical protein